MTTATPRKGLKKDIIVYLQSVGVIDRELIIKALNCIKESSWNVVRVDGDVRRTYREFFKAVPMADGAEFCFKIANNFAPRHYKVISEFAQRYYEIEQAEMKAAEALEAGIDKEIDYQHDPLGDSEYDDLGTPDFAVCIYERYIEVRAYQSGMGEVLPKQGRKYTGCQGDIRWQYPLSALPELQRLGRPVVNVASLQVKP